MAKSSPPANQEFEAINLRSATWDQPGSMLATIQLLVSGLIPTAIGVLILFEVLVRNAGGINSVAGLITGAALSLALPVNYAVDSLIKARVEVQRIRAIATRTDLEVARTNKAIEDSKDDWRKSLP